MTADTTRAARVPLSAFGPAFGLSGLAGTWTAASHALSAPSFIGLTLWGGAALTWLVTSARYLARSGGARAILADLRHPVLGPFAALFATVGLLLSGRLVDQVPDVAETAVWVMAGIAVAYAAWFLSLLLAGGGSLDAVHGAYLLPTVAAAFIAGQSLAATGAHRLALGAWAVGLLSWIMMGTVIMARLAFRPALPDGLVPTLAIFSAPPAVAGNAWFVMNGGRIDLVEELLLGTFIVLMLVQLLLVPRYARLTFGLSFWALTFTAASSATYGLHWLALTRPQGHVVWEWAVVAVVTAFIAWIAAKSIELVVRARQSRPLTGGRTSTPVSPTSPARP